MVDLRKAPVARVLLPYVCGLVAGQLGEAVAGVPLLLLICLLIWMALFLLYRANRRGYGSVPFFVAGTFLLLTLAGFGTGMVSRPADPRWPAGERVVMEGVVTGGAVPGNRYLSLEMRVSRVCAAASLNTVPAMARIYTAMPSDSILPAEGEVWRVCGQLYPVRNNGNPRETDYETILRRQDLWYSLFADTADLAMNRVGVPSGLLSAAGRFRSLVSGHWGGDSDEVSLLKAVCLGDRSAISSEMRQDYAGAGGMHLLAVSGLHVGLIWWFLRLALGWMVRLFRREAFRSCTILCLLWFYAWVAGFSPSVSRSVTMFSFFTLSGMLARRSCAVNTILVSAFFLLLIDPRMILDTGFQLSYTAVLGIVTLFPVLRGICTVRSRFPGWIRDAALVSLSAQFSTAPLVAYYFHQLPIYSVFTNLLAIPLLSVLISLFLVSLPLSAAGIILPMIRLLTGVAGLMNRIMDLFASIPGAVIGDLYPQRPGVVLMMVLWAAGTIALHERSTLPRFVLVAILSGLLILSGWTRCRDQGSGELAVSHYSGCSVVTFREGLRVDHYVHCRDSLSRERAERGIAVSWNKRKFRCTTLEIGVPRPVIGKISASLPAAEGIYLVGNGRLRGWILTGGSEEGSPNLPVLEDASFILLSGEPGISITGGIPVAGDCDIILDGSNRSWYVESLWPPGGRIHVTGQTGAYLRRW